ncbi:helix-turn-helix domain-containing protein [Shewanella avicenniae]|uniref:Helix-turn-helix domain-containing protein n=1 Tax=Shewanella avicenniae TaxID=2814294 RepID=A0ABX7QP91_9GAMM|nr:AlkA N-terminal domain-containing protein [Shewanella avicenniae]QSX32555.1 helix-turn-helix domain-containing protein [Shewanella avicenniae]
MNKATHPMYQQARLSRDPRFDGVFFVGVKTTGIYCRPICPAVLPKEQNVEYFASAAAAAFVGLRPCLRCRPESAPGSHAWVGNDTTLKRAVTLIEQAALDSDHALLLEPLCERLGISSRYLRHLFAEKLGVSPTKYANYCRLLFAKQLLHQTNLSITDVAFASGFRSLRRFNEVFMQQLCLTPSALRRNADSDANRDVHALTLTMSYRPPYDWHALVAFFQLRAVEGMEWFSEDGQMGYGRTLQIGRAETRLRGAFFAYQQPERHCLHVKISLENDANLRLLPQLVQTIRRILDVDAEPQAIMQRLLPLVHLTPSLSLTEGTRIAGVASMFEAGVRAILGQQVSVTQAIRLLNQWVISTGEKYQIGAQQRLFFPEPAMAYAADIALPMPQSRRNTLHALCQWCHEHDDHQSPEQWLAIKGIGPWTVAYAKMRGQSWPDVLLTSDLVIKKQLQLLRDSSALADREFEHWLVEQASPWGSYLTFMLWRNATQSRD